MIELHVLGEIEAFNEGVLEDAQAQLVGGELVELGLA